jgi:hypothetical protein
LDVLFVVKLIIKANVSIMKKYIVSFAIRNIIEFNKVRLNNKVILLFNIKLRHFAKNSRIFIKRMDTLLSKDKPMHIHGLFLLYKKVNLKNIFSF